MKKDITTAEDIQLLVNSFYDKVRMDPAIGFLFDDVAHVDWERHLPVMYAFWENVLFMTGGYSGNPMTAHLKLHGQYPLTKFHFDRWYELFKSTVDEHFEGEVAEKARQRALSISTIMQIRIIGAG
jgi:hemoglobin